jgi:hypothetical protein
MAYSITTVINDLAGVVHGTTVNKIPNLYGVLSRTARQVLLDVDPKETQRIVTLSPVFDNVFDYPAPPDLKGDRIVDIRPQAGRNSTDVFTQGYGTSFDANKSVSYDKKIYTQWNTGVKTLRIQDPAITSPVTITDTSTITGWSTAYGATNLSLDTTANVAGGGALQFDLIQGQTTAQLSNSTLTPLNLANNANISTLFLWVFMPNALAINSVQLIFGSDLTTNYFQETVTTTQQGTAFQNGWNLLAFPWATATQINTPITTAINSVSTVFNTTGAAVAGMKIDNLTSNLPAVLQAVYYSKYLFRDPSTNAFQETVVDYTDNGKLINLDTDSYNLFFNKAAYFISQQLQGADAAYDTTFWDNEYQMALQRYKGLNPSEAMNKGTSYYRPARKGYGQYGPNFFGQ